MLFAIGTKVRFRYTGEGGTVTALLGEGMLQVRLNNDPDLEIPAFEEDLIRNEEAETVSTSAKSIPSSGVKKPEPPPRRRLTAQYHILKPKGLQLAFEPMPGRDESVTRYKAWLINDTSYEFLLELDLFTASRDVLAIDDKIGAQTALELGDVLLDDLNDSLEAAITVRRITTAGLDEPLQNDLKIRPKQFFNNAQTVPILNLLAHHFLLLNAFEPQKSATDSLKDYTQQKATKPKPFQHRHSSPYSAYNVEEFANFIPEIDLHIEQLLNGHARLDKGEILRIQMLHFERFLDKAVRLGVPRIFVIHGVGEGKLREAIAAHLRAHPHVAKFKNEYHHKYGYGATEVVLD
ncbi:MAG: Smr/MutS family protein [Saprospiraceae bacterium]|nr:Smr/MutS family protein [Saprospiraceae bacterium]